MCPIPNIRIITHIPHSSILIPGDVREQFLLTDAELEKELIVMTDHLTDELFHKVVSGALEIKFPVSRLVVDPERFPDDADEPMASVGMGIIYEQTSDLKQLRRPISKEERLALIDNLYHPHHRRLNEAANEVLSCGGRCLVLDCHSFPAAALPYEQGGDKLRPEICLGTDVFHTPEVVVDTAIHAFQEAGFSVAVNEPFSGALVPSEFYRLNERVMALMVEVRRDLYLDEATGQKVAAFAKVQRLLRGCVSKVVESIND